MRFKRDLCLLAAAFLFTFSCDAQTSTSQISGTVRDSSSAVIPAATVTLTNESTGVVQKQSTTEAGVYAFPAIPVGVYTVKAEASGFRALVRSRNVVQVNTPLTVDLSMEIGSASDSVEVAASAEALQTSSATLGNVVEQRAVVNLPLNGRNPLNLLMYEPGVVQRSAPIGR